MGAEEGGHGTHVAGTIAGAQSGEEAGDDEGDGMAFQGKLAVFDFGDSDKFNGLSTPAEVNLRFSSCFVSCVGLFFCVQEFYYFIFSRTA